MSGAIRGSDSGLYLENVHRHQLDDDVRFLRKFARFPAGTRILDVGFGSGALLEFLAREPGYGRRLAGIELSPELFAAKAERLQLLQVEPLEGDFLGGQLPAFGRPDALVMSFYLHHQSDPHPHLARAAALGKPGTKLIVYDRLLRSEAARADFARFWDERYRGEHEWAEDRPNLVTLDSLVRMGAATDFRFVRHLHAPHDQRPETEPFRKTAVEFWLLSPEVSIPACILVHPPFAEAVNDVIASLVDAQVQLINSQRIRYSGDLVRAIYPGLPWTDLLADWTERDFGDEHGMLIHFTHASGDTWRALAHLDERKRLTRKRLGVVHGPTDPDRGTRALYRAYHVPEPWESVGFVQAATAFAVE